jgi:hypothetical protein
MYSFAPLLVHSEAVPPSARAALRAALESPDREAELEAAARVLYLETDLECRDVRELVGLEAIQRHAL